MNLKFKNKRKGFTIVELVIVIAIIGVLSAILIPTFVGLINKANVSADVMTVRNINTELKIEEELNGKPATYGKMLEVAGAAGYDVNKLNPTANGYSIVYDLEQNTLYLYDEKGALVSNQKSEPSSRENLWAMVSTVEETNVSEDKVYGNVYFRNETETADLTVSNGIEVIGKNNVTFSSEKEGNYTLVLNGGNLTVNAPNATVYSYGNKNSVEIQKVANHSYHEYGNVETIDVLGGHFVAEANANIENLIVSSNASDNVSIDNNGKINVLNTIDASVSVSISNKGVIETAIVSETQIVSGKNPSESYKEIKKLTADSFRITEGGYYDGTGVTISSKGTVDESKFALLIDTHENVIINGVTLTGIRGICVGDLNTASGAYNVTILNSTISVSERAVQLWYFDIPEKSGSTIVVRNCNFSNTTITDYDNNTSSMTYGLMLNGIDNANVSIEDSTIQGFGYALMLNNGGTNTNSNFKISNSVIKGRAAVEAMNTYDNNFVIENNYIRCINTFTGSSEKFANIVVDAGDNNVFDIKDNRFEVYRAPATVNNGQAALSIRSAGHTINLIGNNTMVGYIYFSNESKIFPTSSEELCELIMLSSPLDTQVNGSFASSVAICTQGSNQVTLVWDRLPSRNIEDYFTYAAIDGSWVECLSNEDFEIAIANYFMDGEMITLNSNNVVLSNSTKLSALKNNHTFKICFNGYSITQNNNATIIITAGVTVKTDSKVSVSELFSAVDGYSVVESVETDGTYTYKSVANA